MSDRPLKLTRAQLCALGGAACFAAVALSESGTAGEAQQASIRLRKTADSLIKSSGLTPTQLKDLGLDLIKQANEAPGHTEE